MEITDTSGEMDIVHKPRCNETNGAEVDFARMQTISYNRCDNVDDTEECSIAKRLRQKNRKHPQSPNKRAQPFKIKAHKVVS